jgi:hypothetical protein
MQIETGCAGCTQAAAHAWEFDQSFNELLGVTACHVRGTART